MARAGVRVRSSLNAMIQVSSKMALVGGAGQEDDYN